MPFLNNDLPGVMLAHGARRLVHREGVLPGRVAVVGNGQPAFDPDDLRPRPCSAPAGRHDAVETLVPSRLAQRPRSGEPARG